MCNQFEIMKLFESFSNKYSESLTLEKNLKDLSYDENHNIYVCDRELGVNAISLDDIAHTSYRKFRYKDSNKESDSIASVDAFLVTSNKEWYFIEFKNRKVNASKDSVNSKAYQGWHMIMDIMDIMKKEGSSILPEYYENPLEFARKHVTYILVFKASADAYYAGLVMDSESAKIHYKPEYMEKIERYLYKSAFAITEDILYRMLKNGEITC